MVRSVLCHEDMDDTARCVPVTRCVKIRAHHRAAEHEQMFEAANPLTTSGRDFAIKTKAANGELATSNVVPTKDKS